MKIVKKIIEEVKTNGDKAIRYYTKKFDRIDLDNFIVTKYEIKKAYESVDKDTIKALEFAKKNIEEFAKKQKQQFKDFKIKKNGMILGQKCVPIEKIGAYIPGGNYPLPSTALMCIVPARVAGVKEIITCSPKIKTETIVAADIAGADKIFKIGGIQAIAAMAYGTKSIPKVDKIVGPGNIYVTAAKKAVYGDCGIDLPAGPSEILVIADEKADYKLISADILAQLEHAVDTRAFLVSNSGELIKKIKIELRKQLKNLGTKEIINKSLRKLEVKLVKNIQDSIKIADEIAPEHLSLQIKNPEKYADKLKNYGSLFIGKYSAIAFGDYCSGTNHVLPTGGSAKYTGGLSVKDFVKFQTFQKISKNGAKKLGPTTVKLSKVEGLTAHKRSVEIRLS